MDKLLLLSCLVMMVVVPLRAARSREPKRALRRALTGFFAFNVIYWFAVVMVWFNGIHGARPKNLLFDEKATDANTAKRDTYEFESMERSR